MADCAWAKDWNKTVVMQLSARTLDQLSAHTARPGYDRTALRTGILDLGPGAFHRAHQAAWTKDCPTAGAVDWGIAAASLRSAATRDALAPQDGLDTLGLRQNDTQSIRVIGALTQLYIAPELGLQDIRPVLAKPFFQWVIDDHLPSGRPAWEVAGVEFATNVAPFKAMKLRLLNRAHTTLAARTWASAASHPPRN